ncbi:hypothetical protein WK95_05860 [Burkholderia ubonensis]|nr:hypothetical protein WK82_17150 [Burkholderia ubonensis]KVW47582.1 hypothetical protein WK95_05860 [Burkholderia ubonensis]
MRIAETVYSKMKHCLVRCLPASIWLATRGCWPIFGGAERESLREAAHAYHVEVSMGLYGDESAICEGLVCKHPSKYSKEFVEQAGYMHSRPI